MRRSDKYKNVMLSRTETARTEADPELAEGALESLLAEGRAEALRNCFSYPCFDSPFDS